MDGESLDQRYVGWREYSRDRDGINREIAGVKIAQAQQQTEIAHVGQQVSGVDKKLDAISEGLQAMSRRQEQQPPPTSHIADLVQAIREVAPMLKKPSNNAAIPWWVWTIVGGTLVWALMHYLGVRP